ncbi:MAG: ABC transporter ATP-binding protein, partial [Elusimicrobiota bacterium]
PPSQAGTDILMKYTNHLIPLDESSFAVKDTDLKSFDGKDAAQLEHLGLMNKTRYIILDPKGLSAQEKEKFDKVLQKYPELFHGTGNFCLVEYEKRKSIQIDDIFVLRQKDLSGVIGLFKLLLCAVGGIFVLSFFHGILLTYIGQKVIYDIRADLFSHLQKLSLSFFDKNPVGRLVTRVTNDTQSLSEAFTGVMVNLFKDFFILGGVLIVVLRLNWRLSLVSFSVLPFMIYVTIIFRKKVREAFREVRVKIARINAYLQENITGMKVVQLFRREKRNLDQFDEINHDNYIANFKQIITFAVFQPMINFLSASAVAIIIWYGGGEVIRENLTLGGLVAFLTYIQMFFRPIQDMSDKYNILQSAMASSERIFMLMDTPVDIKNPEIPQNISNISGNIEFRNVHFSYDGEHPILKNISFKIKKGEKIAIVGHTGSGKTTVISLLTRLYEPQQGTILIDGVNIKDFNLKELRSNISVVMQDVFIFSGNIESNIRMGNTDISNEQVVESAHCVKADSFIEKLPDGYKHEVKERGATFSTGERQLLSFARALAFDPKILVLDEATSSTDTHTEQLLQEGLFNLMEGRTSIIIAHRLSTIKKVDRILVMHNGELVEEGKHEELLAKKGLYEKLYTLQYQTVSSASG